MRPNELCLPTDTTPFQVYDDDDHVRKFYQYDAAWDARFGESDANKILDRPGELDETTLWKASLADYAGCQPRVQSPGGVEHAGFF